MEQLAEVVKRGLELADGVGSITAITFFYRLNGEATDYLMENGETNLDGISCSRANAALTVSRTGANLDIENTSGASITVNQVAITASPASSGVTSNEILPLTTISDIVIPDGQVARINGISFTLIKQP